MVDLKQKLLGVFNEFTGNVVNQENLFCLKQLKIVINKCHSEITAVCY